MMSSTPDSAELIRFLRALWPDLGGRWCLLWGAPSKRSRFVQDFTEPILAELVAWGAKENVYVGCGLRAANLGATMRGDKADVVAIPGVWLDLDYGTEHKKPNLPPTEQDAMDLMASMGPPPSAVIHSGRGLQAWWLFREPWDLTTPEERITAEALTMGWCTTLRARAKTKGWDADQVGDLTRVMRLPGLWNRKGVPLKTKLLSLTEARYDPSDLETYLLAGTEQKEPLPQLTWHVELAAHAEPPADKFLRLCEIDAQFVLSWNHARADWQDQSASAYDLSLATRAFAAGWSPQEIVNLLIACRRKHKADLKLRKDYYERTLTRALSGKDEEQRKQLAEDLKAGKPLPEDVKRDQAEMFALLSTSFNVAIARFVKYRGEQNTYQLELNHRLVNVPEVGDIESQTRFRRLILDHANVLIPSFKADKWREHVEMLFAHVQEVDVDGSTNRTAYEGWIEMYLSDGVEPEEQWMKAAVEYRPFRIGKDTFIVTEGFRRFLWSQMGEKVATQQLSTELTKLGYRNERKNVTNHKGRKTKRSVWNVG